MLPQFKFDERVAVEALLYILNRTRDKTFHHTMKILYFADRIHLEQYGRFICGDTYIAMTWGPVPSAIYDMLKERRGDEPLIKFPLAIGAIGLSNSTTAQPLRPPDMDWLSRSEVECMDEALRKYDRLAFPELKKLSHDSAYNATPLNGVMKLEDIVAAIGNPEGLLEYLQDPYP